MKKVRKNEKKYLRKNIRNIREDIEEYDWTREFKIQTCYWTEGQTCHQGNYLMMSVLSTKRKPSKIRE